MHNYKALKSASKVSVQKVKVVDDGNITTKAQSEISHEELQVVSKRYNPSTGEAQDDIVSNQTLSSLKTEIDRCKSDVTEMQAKQADLEQLEKDLKAL